MNDLLEFRINTLVRLSDHFRELAAGVFSLEVSAEIASVADEFAHEAVRINRECVGRRTCPCEFGDACLSMDGLGPFFGARDTRKAA